MKTKPNPCSIALNSKLQGVKLQLTLFHINTQKHHHCTFSQCQGVGVSTSNLNHWYQQRYGHFAACCWDIKKLLKWYVSTFIYSTDWDLAWVCCLMDAEIFLVVHFLLPPRRTRVQTHTEPDCGPHHKLSRPHHPAPPHDLIREGRESHRV